MDEIKKKPSSAKATEGKPAKKTPASDSKTAGASKKKPEAKKKPAAKKAPAKKPAPKKEKPAIVAAAVQPDSQLTTFEKLQEERADKRLNMVRGAVAILFVLCLAYTVYALTRPPVIIKKATTVTATSTAKKAVVRASQAGRVYISRLGIDEPLYLSPSGTVTQDDLLKGANFYNEETSQAGVGNCVIFGHSAVTSEHGAPFGAIGDGLAKVGDKIVLTDASNFKFTYVVDKIFEIEATDFSVVQPLQEGETPVITIITCIAPNYPKDKRVVVHGVLQK